MKLSRMLFVGVITIILSSSYLYAYADAGDCGPWCPITEKRIKTDLIGKSISSSEGSWNFDSLSEFKEFKITNTLETDDISEYRIEITLQDMRTFKSYYARIHVVYKKGESDWEFVKVSLLKYIKME